MRRFVFVLIGTIGIGHLGCRSTSTAGLSESAASEVMEKFDTAETVQDVYNTTSKFNAQTKMRYENRQSKAYVITAATFNAGLLEATVLQYAGAKVPYYDDRRQHIKQRLKAFIQDKAPIFISLQEVFYDEDVKLIKEVATENGYGLLRFGNSASTGTMILYRKNNLTPSSARKQYPVMPFTVTLEDELVVDRSVIGALFWMNNKTSAGLKVLVASAHLSYALGKEENAARLTQVAAMTDMLTSKANLFDVDAVILGADFNLSPVIGSHVYDSGKGVKLSSDTIGLWQENTKGYVNFFNQMKDFRTLDTWYAANPLPKPLEDRLVIDDTAPNRHLVGFTEDPVTSYLTKTGPTTKEEPAQRLDYVWVGTRARRGHPPVLAHVLSSKLAFDQPLKNEKGRTLVVDGKHPLHLSDHYGVVSEVALFRDAR